MRVDSVYPVLMVAKPEESADFFVEHFAFVETFRASWYVSLTRDGHELAFLSHDHPTVPARFRAPVSGVLVNIEIDDAAGEYERLSANGRVEIVQPLRDEEFGQRHFIVEGPEGVLVDVIQGIPPTGAFADG